MTDPLEGSKPSRRTLRGQIQSELVPVLTNAGIRGLTLGSKFVLVIALARLFLPADLGIYGLMSSSVAIGVFAVGLEYKYVMVRRLISRSPAQRAAMLRDQAFLYAITGAVAVCLLLLLIVPVSSVGVPGYLLTWFGLIVFAELIAQESSNALMGVGRPVASNVVLFVRWGAWVYPLIGLVIFAPEFRDVQTVLVAWFLGGLASFAIAAWCLRDLDWRAAMRAPVDWPSLRSGVSASVPFLVTSGASLGLLFFDRYVIGFYQGVVAVGIYTFFATLTTSVHTLVNAGVSFTRMPRLVAAHEAGDLARFRAESQTMRRLTLVSALGSAALLAMVVVPLSSFVGQPAYLDHFGVFAGLLAAAVLRSIADPPLYALYARGRDALLLVVNGTAFVVVALADLTLVPGFGIEGAAVAAIAGASTLLLLATVLSSRGFAQAGTHPTVQPAFRPPDPG